MGLMGLIGPIDLMGYSYYTKAVPKYVKMTGI